MDDRATPARWDAVADFGRTFGPRFVLFGVSILYVWTSWNGTARAVVIFVLPALFVLKITYDVVHHRRRRPQVS
jgi:hypothetical protein